jgi:hypothetical protein
VTPLHIREHFVGFLDLPVHVLGHAIARVDAGVIAAGEAPVGALDLIHGRGSIQTQEFVEIHYLASPLSWAIADRVIEPWQSIARSGDGRRLS